MMGLPSMAQGRTGSTSDTEITEDQDNLTEHGIRNPKKGGHSCRAGETYLISQARWRLSPDRPRASVEQWPRVWRTLEQLSLSVAANKSCVPRSLNRFT